MKLLICGGRDFNDYDKLRRVLDELVTELGTISEVIEGGARGGDELGRRWAKENSIPVRTYHADWKKYGRKAGVIRNIDMVVKGRPDIVVAFPTAKSVGTRQTIGFARDKGIRVIVHETSN